MSYLSTTHTLAMLNLQLAQILVYSYSFPYLNLECLRAHNPTIVQLNIALGICANQNTSLKRGIKRVVNLKLILPLCPDTTLYINTQTYLLL